MTPRRPQRSGGLGMTLVRCEQRADDPDEHDQAKKVVGVVDVKVVRAERLRPRGLEGELPAQAPGRHHHRPLVEVPMTLG